MAKLTTTPGIATKAEFAARVDLTRGRISQLIGQGLPVRSDGRIEVEAGLQWMEDNLNTDRRNKGGTQASAGAPTLAEAKRLHEILKVQRARLSLDKERGDLVSRAEVKSAVFARARRERDAHMAWVARTAPLLAAELGGDPARTFTALDRFMREHLLDLARTPLGVLSDG